MEYKVLEIMRTITELLEKAGGVWVPTEEAKPEDKAFMDVMNKIIATERDHLNALQYIYNRMIKDKPETATTEFAKSALTEYRDQKKLIR